MCQKNCCCTGSYALQIVNTGIESISAANANLDGSGATMTVLTAGESGTVVKSITIKATEPTTKGMVRLFIGNGTDTVYSLSQGGALIHL